MIQNLNDFYKLIKSPMYHATYNPYSEDTPGLNFSLINDIAPFDYVRVSILKNNMELYKYKNMNSEFYAHVRTTTKIGKKIHDLLIAKRMVAMVKDIEKNYR